MGASTRSKGADNFGAEHRNPDMFRIPGCFHGSEVPCSLLGHLQRYLSSRTLRRPPHLLHLVETEQGFPAKASADDSARIFQRPSPLDTHA